MLSYIDKIDHMSNSILVWVCIAHLVIKFLFITQWCYCLCMFGFNQMC